MAKSNLGDDAAKNLLYPETREKQAALQKAKDAYEKACKTAKEQGLFSKENE